MPAGTTSASIARIPWAPTAPSLARRHVRRELSGPMTPACLAEIVLLTSELVANAVEHSRTGPIEVAVTDAPTLTRIEVSSPSEAQGRRPQMHVANLDEVGGRGLFLVDRLSDRWGIDEDKSTVWFELDHYAPRPSPSCRVCSSQT